MHAVGDRVVRTTVLDQFVQLLLEHGVLVAQHQHLALDERDGCAAALMRQLDACQHGTVAFEKIGVRDEEVRNLVFGQLRGGFGTADRFVHLEDSGDSAPVTATWPSKAVSAGPVSQIGSPGPGQRTISRPPGTSTFTSSASGPCRRPTATAAQAPVPHAWVSPTPRSNTRSLTLSGVTISRKPTFTRRGNRG